MENQLYVRIRGRILGPYDQDKLQSLARRGQLSRLHEVSQDATNWVRASTYPELFVGKTHRLPRLRNRPPWTAMTSLAGRTFCGARAMVVSQGWS